jgi:hypothetical protein
MFVQWNTFLQTYLVTLPHAQNVISYSFGHVCQIIVFVAGGVKVERSSVLESRVLDLFLERKNRSEVLVTGPENAPLAMKLTS